MAQHSPTVNALIVGATGNPTVNALIVDEDGNVVSTPGFAITGATANGVADDSAAINAAIARASAAGGGFVLAPDFQYGVGSSISVPSNVTIVGQGKNATIFRKLGNSGMFDFSGASNASRVQRGGLRDLKLDGQGFTGSLINAKWADHLNFERLWLFNNGAVGTKLENVWDTYFNNVEWDTVSGIDGFNPSTLIGSNADDSSNIIVFNECRWENYKDGALWISSGPIVSAYTMATGANPVYGVFLTNCKMETPQLRGLVHCVSSDVQTVHMDGMYVATRGLFAGVVTGRTIFDVVGIDQQFHRMRILNAGVTNPTASAIFRLFTNGNCVFRDIQFDVTQNPSTSVFNIAGGTPDALIDNVTQRSGQTATMFAGTWPPSVASATATTLPKNPGVVTITGTTNITSVTADIPGRRVTLRFAGVLTFTDGSNLKLAGNFVTAADAAITLVSDGTNWYETSRSTN